MEPYWSMLYALSIGIGLSAACGFRILLPFFGLSIAAMNGTVKLSPEFLWVGTWPALMAFATATGIEIAAYGLPGVDNFLDVIATPLAVAAGIIAMACVVSDGPPFLRWSIALMAGGGMAGAVQTGTAVLRGLSTAHTAGTANIFLAAAELAGSAVLTFLAVVVPVLALTVVALIAIGFFWKMVHHRPRP